MSLAGFVTITRPTNALVAGIAAVIAYLIATGTVIPEALYLFVIVSLITAAGNVINDYFDASIDAINRPERPIPSGKVTRMAARGFSVMLFLGGILVSLFTNQLCIAIAIFNSLLLVAYAANLKTTPFFGNVTVSYLAASMFLFGGALNGTEGLIHVLPVALITFFAMLSRELVKDAEDVEGDAAGGASTLPILIGVKKTASLAFIFAVLAVIASLFPYFWWGIFYIAGIIPVDIVILVAAGRAISRDSPAGIRNSGAATLLKIGFFASLLVFTLSAIFLTRV
jgi:geranylgeranylglycerol-phosphate geranylgeranyltransferase